MGRAELWQMITAIVCLALPFTAVAWTVDAKFSNRRWVDGIFFKTRRTYCHPRIYAKQSSESSLSVPFENATKSAVVDGEEPLVNGVKNSNNVDSPFLLQRGRVITHSPDQVAETTLGDIMSMGLITGSSPPSRGDAGSSSSSPASATMTLAHRFGINHPLDRMALTANGNLQRLVSSYYDSPVTVVVDSQSLSSSNSSCSVWNRVVHLTVFGETFCTATSVICVYDITCQTLVESGKVGLGQLFRYLDLLPEFTLLDAGKLGSDDVEEQPGGGNFWREYRLDCRELSCWIREEFSPALWELRQ